MIIILAHLLLHTCPSPRRLGAPGIVLGTGGATALKKTDKNPCPFAAYVLAAEAEGKGDKHYCKIHNKC